MYRIPLPKQDYLLSRLRYDPDTGKLFWKAKQVREGKFKRHDLSWNTRYAGKEAFNNIVKTSGYLTGVLDDKSYVAHRIIFKMIHGWEPVEIDHDDRNRQNNKPGNLIPSDHIANNKNQKLRSTNTSGCMGVSWQAHAKKWKVKISNTHIGYADTFEAAVAMREQAMIEHNYHPKHGI